MTRAMDIAYSYSHLLNSRMWCERVIEAQQEDFDVAVITICGPDAFVKKSHELVDIHVIALGETALF